MYKYLFFFTFLACFTASAQSISPFSINVGGATAKTLDYNIGESSSIAYFQYSAQFSLSTGFIQSFTPLVTGIINLVFEEGEGLTLSPNPASERIRLKGVLSRPGFFEFHLIDVQGRILETYPSTYYINYLDKEINVTQLMGGTYFIRLIYTSPDAVNQSTSFKFSRIN
jgi:hypothetical protein